MEALVEAIIWFIYLGVFVNRKDVVSYRSIVEKRSLSVDVRKGI